MNFETQIHLGNNYPKSSAPQHLENDYMNIFCWKNYLPIRSSYFCNIFYRKYFGLSPFAYFFLGNILLRGIICNIFCRNFLVYPHLQHYLYCKDLHNKIIIAVFLAILSPKHEFMVNHTYFFNFVTWISLLFTNIFGQQTWKLLAVFMKLKKR